VQGRNHTYSNITVYDIFPADDFRGDGLRALLHVEGPEDDTAASLDRLLAASRPFDLLFVEPFDPAGRIAKTSGTLRAWLPPAKSSRPNEPLRYNADQGFARPVLSANAGHSDGIVLVDDDLAFALSHAGRLLPIRPHCRAQSAYIDARDRFFVACGDAEGATEVEDAQGNAVFRLPPVVSYRRPRDGLFAFPPAHILLNADAIAVKGDELAIVRVASGAEPATVDNPAWLLKPGEPPVELAPWSTLEVASSPACASGDGYRAVVQTTAPWVHVEGAVFKLTVPGMAAIVRWSTERVCLEAIEVGLRTEPGSGVGFEGERPLDVMVVARFVGDGAGAGVVGTGAEESVRQPARCELVPP
jgi:hypothetical protein